MVPPYPTAEVSRPRSVQANVWFPAGEGGRRDASERVVVEHAGGGGRAGGGFASEASELVVRAGAGHGTGQHLVGGATGGVVLGRPGPVDRRRGELVRQLRRHNRMIQLSPSSRMPFISPRTQ